MLQTDMVKNVKLHLLSPPSSPPSLQTLSAARLPQQHVSPISPQQPQLENYLPFSSAPSVEMAEQCVRQGGSVENFTPFKHACCKAPPPRVCDTQWTTRATQERGCTEKISNTHFRETGRLLKAAISDAGVTFSVVGLDWSHMRLYLERSSRELLWHRHTEH